MKRLAVLGALVLVAGTALAQQQSPLAPVRGLTDDYYGTKVVDPYRWMEDTKGPEFQSWMKVQADHTNAVMGAIPGRQKLLDRIKQLDNAGVLVRTTCRPTAALFSRKNSTTRRELQTLRD